MKHLVAEEAARDVNLLTPHNNDFLAVQDLLRNNGSKSAEEVALTINDDGGRGESGHGESIQSRNKQVFSQPEPDLKAGKRADLDEI